MFRFMWSMEKVRLGRWWGLLPGQKLHQLLQHAALLLLGFNLMP